MLGAAAAMLLALVGAPAAAAEEQPAILKAYGLDWIERVRDDAWPQPKALRPVICLLDTGVAITPDTPADNPDGPIVARLSVEDASVDPSIETGHPQGTQWAHLHGTRMASIIAAPRNDYGTVGIFPQARIVSVRVTEGDAVHITPAAIRGGARVCNMWAARAGVRLATLIVAESGYAQRADDTRFWEFAASLTSERGGVLVAAVGNDPSAETVAPMSARGVVAVGAGNDAGGLCSFAPTGEAQVVGPGCSEQPNWNPGSSSATAAVGALLAAVATRKPGLDQAELRQALGEWTATRSLNGALAQPLFDGFLPGPPAPPPPPQRPELAITAEPEVAGTKSPEIRLWKPEYQARWRGGKLTILRTRRRAEGSRVIQFKGTNRELTMVGVRKSFRLDRRPKSLVAYVRAKDGTSWRSLSRGVRVGL